MADFPPEAQLAGDFLQNRQAYLTWLQHPVTVGFLMWLWNEEAQRVLGEVTRDEASDSDRLRAIERAATLEWVGTQAAQRYFDVFNNRKTAEEAFLTTLVRGIPDDPSEPSGHSDDEGLGFGEGDNEPREAFRRVGPVPPFG